MPTVKTAAAPSSSSSEMRRRRVATTTADGEVTRTSMGDEKPSGGVAEPIPVTLASGWRCAQATMIVFVILNVVLALWIVVEVTNLRHDVSELIANGTTVTAAAAAHRDGVGPRMDTMARVAEAATDAFRKRNNP